MGATSIYLSPTIESLRFPVGPFSYFYLSTDHLINLGKIFLLLLCLRRRDLRKMTIYFCNGTMTRVVSDPEKTDSASQYNFDVDVRSYKNGDKSVGYQRARTNKRTTWFS